MANCHHSLHLNLPISIAVSDSTLPLLGEHPAHWATLLSFVFKDSGGENIDKVPAK